MTKQATKRVALTHCDLTVGTRIFYTGDMANREGSGEIVAVADCKWYTKSYTVRLDDGRTFTLTPASFRVGPGRRFWLQAERDAYWAEAVSKLKARVA